jgi:Arc/MetJ-type ribon-helix-helix transcriptional regulator
MTIKLTPELEQYVREQVRSGAFPDENALIDAALTLLRLELSATPDVPGGVPWTHESLRAALQVGLDQLKRGESGPWDARAMKDRVRHQLERERATSAKRAG